MASTTLNPTEFKIVISGIELARITGKGCQKNGQVFNNSFEWKSAADPSKVHEVHVFPDGTMTCTCMAWRFPKDHARYCKHTKATAKLMELAVSILSAYDWTPQKAAAAP